jgi:hypothetical protein
VGEDRVPRDVVLRALEAAGPPHSPIKLYISVTGNWVTVSDGNKSGSLEFVPPSGLIRRAVNRLNRKYKVPRDWFYDPLQIPGDETKRKPC